MRSFVYADFAATTPTDPRVVEAMKPYYEMVYGNPSSVHHFGRLANKAISTSSNTISEFLNSKPEEIYYTSSGTESNNLALLGIAKANRNKGRHIITTVIEHPSVINVCRILENDGFSITYLPVDNLGLVDKQSLERAIRQDTILVSIHLANSEIGVIQLIQELSSITRDKGIYFHTDACQAAAYLDLDVNSLGVDLLSFNGSKMYGPKGIAVLYVREGVNIFPIFYGGGQQKSLRSGTENVPGIIGLAKACKIITNNKELKRQNIRVMRDNLQKDLEKIGCIINIKKSNRLPNHLSIVVKDSTSQNLVMALDELGVSVSAGSACSSRQIGNSYVLSAIGLSTEEINQTVRISLGYPSTQVDCAKIVRAVSTIKKSP